MKRYILVIFSAFLLVACASTGTVVPPPSESAGEYRDLQGELYQQQTDIAVAGQKIEDQGRGLVEDLTRLEEAIAASPDAGEVDRIYWLSQVQSARAEAEVNQADIENLNRQLAVERETVKRQYQKFNEYETAMTGELSAKGTENSRLREEVKTVKGQRNTLLAIVITAGVVILCFVVFKVLRFFRVIPI
jgi:PBP1b-binding outer membrane lipoprotein LpoB